LLATKHLFNRSDGLHQFIALNRTTASSEVANGNTHTHTHTRALK